MNMLSISRKYNNMCRRIAGMYKSHQCGPLFNYKGVLKRLLSLPLFLNAGFKLRKCIFTKEIEKKLILKEFYVYP